MTRSRLERQRRRSLVLVGGVLFVTVAAFVAGVVIGPAIRTPEQAAADAAPPPASLVTAVAEERVLVEPVVARGTVAAGESVKVAAPVGLTGPSAVVTAVVARPGSVLAEGDVVIEVAGQPVFGLVLPFPLYRDITAEARGPDVTEVQKALRRLGQKTPVDGVFGAATQDALRAFYTARRYTAPTEVAAEGTSETPAKAPAPAAKTPVLLRNHVVRLDRATRTLSSVLAAVGTTLKGAESVVAELDAGSPTVQVLVPGEQQAQLKAGNEADVVDEVRGERAKARVVSISAEIERTDKGEGHAVSLAFDGTPLTPRADHSVLVTISPRADAKPVLAVPVTAVYSRPDGKTFVSAVSAEATTTDIVVHTGESIGGWVAVTPVDAELKPGTRVAVGLSANVRADGGEQK